MTWVDVVAFADQYQPAARAIECPRCKAPPHAACSIGGGYIVTPDGTMHRERVEAVAGKPWPAIRTPDQTRGYIADRTEARRMIQALTEAADRDPREVIDQLSLLQHCPRHSAEVGRVLRLGGARHGVIGSAPIWTIANHIEHAFDHVRNAMVAPDSRDRDTDALDLSHGAARCHLGGEELLIKVGR